MTQYFQNGHFYVKTLEGRKAITSIEMLDTVHMNQTYCMVSSNFFEMYQPCAEIIYEAALDAVTRKGKVVYHREEFATV